MTKKKPAKKIAPKVVAKPAVKKAAPPAAPIKTITKTAESSLWAWLALAGIAIADRAKLHWQRIENAVKSGVLDVEGTYDGTSFWLELKSVTGGKTITEKFDTTLTTAQAMFMRSRILAGGRAWLLIQIGGDSNRRYLVYGSHAVELSKPISEARIKKISTPLMDDSALEVLMAVAGH